MSYLVFTLFTVLAALMTIRLARSGRGSALWQRPATGKKSSPGRKPPASRAMAKKRRGRWDERPCVQSSHAFPGGSPSLLTVSSDGRSWITSTVRWDATIARTAASASAGSSVATIHISNVLRKFGDDSADTRTKSAPVPAMLFPVGASCASRFMP